MLLVPVKMLVTSEAKLDSFSCPKCYTGQMQHTLTKKDLATVVYLADISMPCKGLWLAGDLNRFKECRN